MIKTDNLHFNSQQRLRNGIKKIADAVGSTMGTGGSNAVLEAIESPGHILTNDGFSIANSIMLADPIEEMGRKMLLESINRANKASGDGSSTTCVLTAKMIDAGLGYNGMIHPMILKREMEDLLPKIEASLEEQSRQLFDKDGVLDLKLLEQVATISAEDEEIGKRIAEIYSKIGKDGIVYWDISKTSEDSYSIGTGITVEGAGHMSPYLTDIEENGQITGQIRLKNPKIMLVKQKITSASDFDKIGAALFADNVRDLIVFCDDIDPIVIPDIVKTRQMRGFRIAVVKMPVLWRDAWYDDLSKVTGATVISPEAGLPMKLATVSHLGTVGSIIVTKYDTYLDGIADVSEHIQALTDSGEEEALLRATRLNTKTARYFVGAQSDSALSYRRLKVEDAISASYQALNGGIVAGGGTALKNAALELVKNGSSGEAVNVLSIALLEPLNRITSNAGMKDFTIKSESKVAGFDSRTQTEVPDMFEAGIIDPKNVVLNAVKNALSVASTVITAPTIVLLPREEYVEQEQETLIKR